MRVRLSHLYVPLHSQCLADIVIWKVIIWGQMVVRIQNIMSNDIERANIIKVLQEGGIKYMQPQPRNNNSSPWSHRNQVPLYLKDRQHDSPLTQNQIKIISCIANMINANQSQQAEQCLRLMYDEMGLSFIQDIFDIALKSSISRHMALEQIDTNINYSLLYLMHFINQQKSRLPDVMFQFMTTYTALYASKHRQLVVDCIKTYLSRHNHALYAKQFLQSISLQILQALRNNQLQEIDLMMVVEIFEGLVTSKQFRPGLSMEAQRIVNVIINQFCQSRPANIQSQMWRWLMIVLSSFTRFTPTNSFILSEMSNNGSGMSMKSRVRIFQMYIRVHDRFRNIQDMYLLLRLQLQRMGNEQFMNALDEEGGVDAAQTMIKTIKLLIADTLALIRASEGQTDINVHMLMGYFRSYDMWSNVILNCIKVLQVYEQEQTDMSTCLLQIIQQLTQFIEQPQQIRKFILQIKDKLKQQYLFCLLAAMPKPIMDIFQASQILINHCTTLPVTIGRQVRSINCNMFLLQLFLRFVIKYLNVHHYIDDTLVENSIRPFWEYIIQFKVVNSPNNNNSYGQYDQQQIDRYNSNIIKLQAYGISILTRLLKYEREPGIYNATTILQQYYYIFTQAHRIGGNDQSDTTAIVLQSMSQICTIKLYKSMMYECVIVFFNQVLFVKQDIQKQLRLWICLQFLKVLSQCYQFQVLHMVNQHNRLYQIFMKCMLSLNTCLQDQVCTFILHILFTTNSLLHKNQISSVHTQTILAHIYNTKVYQYIKHCLKKQQDDALYCKILMETLLHHKGKPLVQDILTYACSHPHALTTVLKTDQVWEALVILYDVENQYTDKKMINKKINAIRGDDIETLLRKMNIDEQNQYKEKTKTHKKRVNWAWLPEVRRVLEPGSVAGVMVEKKLNQSI